MISVVCTKCRANLQIDDAFAGSACRCHHCGTIQTVPGKSRAVAPTAVAARTLYSHDSPVLPSGTGLDELADAVASSGLHQQLTARKPTGRTPPTVPLAWVVAAGAAVGVIILGLIILLLHQTRGEPAKSGTDAIAAAPGPKTASGSDRRAVSSLAAPQFLDIPLPETTVIYLIDRGSSARESLGHTQAAVMRSIRSLGTDRRFQIVFWDNGQPEWAYPPAGPGFATPQAISSAERALEGVVAFGRSDALGPLSRVLAARPEVIVLITAKGWELDESFVRSMQAAWEGFSTRIHTISVGSAESEALQEVARLTGGRYRPTTPGELRDFAEN
ncbi:MAG: VWA domain-containing protein [Phycisphaerae bacterium]|nr:VWA domain-containing protein [Phycisphaerae bacterium]MDW8263529.1 hypothetical protein [Phycisphaerales bacterium]